MGEIKVQPLPSDSDENKTTRKSDSEKRSVSVIDDEEGKCGYGSCQPRWLQCCNNAKGFLVCYCLVVIVQGMLVNGFINVSISTLEKRFGFKSSETGVMSTGYDIGFCILTMFVTYFGARSHRPQMVGSGIFVMGVGALIFWLPHIATPLYDPTDGFAETCTADDINCTDETNTGFRHYIWVFILAQLLHGFGCTPLFTLGISFMEDSVPKNSASLYLGIGNAVSFFGPMIGYALGGYMLGIYVDFDVVDASEIEITPSDPRWVGAWWLGMMASMACAFVLCIPFFAFPKVVPGTARNRAMRESEVPVGCGEEIAADENFGKSYKDFPKALLILFKNPVYVLGSLASCTEAIVISGVTTFLPKIIETLFQQTAGYAAIVAGVIGVPGGVVGHVVAAILINRFKLKTANIYKLNVLYCIIVCAAAPILILACSNRPVAGVTTPYLGQDGYNGSLWAPCNSDCVCQQQYYTPVCGADNINYFTACHAGCTDSQDINGTQYFFNCSCVNGTHADGWMAKKGNCASDCYNLSLFLGIFFLVVFFNFMTNTPALVATFRVVPPNLRSFALGIQWLLIRVLGAIPGPILLGSIIDLTCILWQTKQCDGTRGSCWIYDSYQMAVNVLAISIVCKVASAILFFSAYWFYKPPVKSVEEIDVKDDTAFANNFTRDSNGNLPSPHDKNSLSKGDGFSKQYSRNNVISSSEEPVTEL